MLGIGLEGRKKCQNINLLLSTVKMQRPEKQYLVKLSKSDFWIVCYKLKNRNLFLSFFIVILYAFSSVFISTKWLPSTFITSDEPSEIFKFDKIMEESIKWKGNDPQNYDFEKKKNEKLITEISKTKPTNKLKTLKISKFNVQSLSKRNEIYQNYINMSITKGSSAKTVFESEITKSKVGLVLGQSGIVKRDLPLKKLVYYESNIKLIEENEAFNYISKSSNKTSLVKILKLKHKTHGAKKTKVALKRLLEHFQIFFCLSLNTKACFSKPDFKALEKERKIIFPKTINRIFGLKQILWSKNSLCDSLGSRLNSNWIDLLSFECFVLPRDYSILETKMKFETLNKINQKYIFKPYKQGGGKGIFLVKDYNELKLLNNEISFKLEKKSKNMFDSKMMKIPNLAELLQQDKQTKQIDTTKTISQKASKKKEYLVQPYLASYPIIDETIEKWDIRAYVLVTNLFPLRAYLFERGLVRFTTKDSTNKEQNKTKFLTNTSVNKKYSKVEDVTMGFDELVNRTNKDIILKMQQVLGFFLLTASKSFEDFYYEEFPKRLKGETFECKSCFHLLGVDIIFDDKLHPRIIEVNGEPSMKLSTKLNQTTKVDNLNHYDKTKVLLQQNIKHILFNQQSYFNHEALLKHSLKTSDLFLVKSNKKVENIVFETLEEHSKLKQTHFRKVWPNFETCFVEERQQQYQELLDKLQFTSESLLNIQLINKLNCGEVEFCINHQQYCDSGVTSYFSINS